ncbi:MAG TPA: peptide chain release factor N(5)-glutamine methyltransferase [Pseudolabrys sp.]|nr:peptide chain release factor N(5)-glutamine methyltransferase [Pseudolabrys sp.]
MRVIPGMSAGVTAAQACKMLADIFRLRGLDTPELDARILVGHALKLDRARLMAAGDRELEPRETDAIQARAARRLQHEPVARIVGHKEFWSLDLRITPAVLVPRPETETVVEAALAAVDAAGARNAPLAVLDIGTGSGAILLALLSELPNASGTGVDISTDALEVARDNASRVGVAARCTFVAANGAGALSGRFDLIVSNPPYVSHGEIASLAPEVREHDPLVALDGGADGLDGYRMIARDAPRLVASTGHLVVELGAGQDAAVSALLTQAGLRVSDIRKDVAGTARALAASPSP